MGSLKDIANQPKLQTFPNAQFMIAGEVPAAQCSEALIEGDHGVTTVGFAVLTDTGAFAGFTLDGKICHIISPAPNAGDHTIAANTDNIVVLLGFDPIDSTDNVYYISDGGALIITRNIQSFAEFIHAAGYAYTIKGGILYTNIPSAQLQPACSILFDPLT